MKYALVLSLFAVMLGGCAVVPLGHGDYRDGYYRGRGHDRGDGIYRDRDYNRGGGYYRDRGYRQGQGSQGDWFRDHGN